MAYSMVSSWLFVWNEFNARDFGLWLWLERVSWFVAAAGIPLLVYQFKVIADELTKRPRIEFGMVPAGAPDSERLVNEIGLVPSWSPEAPWSDIVMVEFRAVNHGQRTARDLVFNLRLPPSGDAQSTPPQIITSPEIKKAEDGSVTMIEKVGHLHPDGIQVIQIPMRVLRSQISNRSVSGIPIIATISMADAKETSFDLTVRFPLE